MLNYIRRAIATRKQRNILQDVVEVVADFDCQYLDGCESEPFAKGCLGCMARAALAKVGAR